MTIYFEDLKIGAEFFGQECIADKEEMLDYAIKNDPIGIHLDEEAAKHSPFGSLIASGGYVITLWYRSCIPIFSRIAFLGAFDWHFKFPVPVRANDKLRCIIRIDGKRASGKPGRGIVTSSQRVLNQDDREVISAEIVWMVATRPSASPLETAC
ncbi:MAG: MaoC/PaaZ C-terminal domain-containing protein [Desulfobacterales bacterium]|nr:MaoC/PaaZ C-terminal domain-containing protein [Desulfobacterales bacterium]